MRDLSVQDRTGQDRIEGGEAGFDSEHTYIHTYVHTSTHT